MIFMSQLSPVVSINQWEKRELYEVYSCVHEDGLRLEFVPYLESQKVEKNNASFLRHTTHALMRGQQD